MEIGETRMTGDIAKKEEISARKEALLQKFVTWFKNPYNLAFFLIFILAVALRLFYFFAFKNQPLWFDEAEYMAKSKNIAFNFKWPSPWSPRKPILLAWMFVPFLKLGFSEPALRFILVLFSIAAVWLAYYVSEEFFDKKVALITTALMAVFWVNMFFSIRFMVDMPATTLFLASLYFFVRGYVKKENPKYIWLAAAFFALGFLMRVSYGIFLIPLLIYMVLEEKFSLLKNKQLWMAVFIAFLVVLPFFIWLFHAFPEDPLGKFIGISYGRFSIGQEHGSMGVPGIWQYFKDIPNELKTTYFVLFLLGCVFVFADLFLGFDLLFKKDYTDIRLKLIILIWILLAIVAFGMTRSYVEQRDSMIYAVFMFSIIGVALIQIYNFIMRRIPHKQAKILALFVIISLVILGAYSQLTYGYSLTKDKSTSYQAVRDAGLWIKQNSKPDDVITSKSLPQIEYYAERHTVDVFFATEEEFIGNATQQNVKFFAPSTFEPYWLVPQWSYTWGQQHPELARLVWWWADNPQQPSQFLLVYELNQTAMQEEWKKIISKTQ
jgi:4-amino-4-deoxy-L-arabinose transferase-like glycosyltransferase